MAALNRRDVWFSAFHALFAFLILICGIVIAAGGSSYQESTGGTYIFIGLLSLAKDVVGFITGWKLPPPTPGCPLGNPWSCTYLSISITVTVINGILLFLWSMWVWPSELDGLGGAASFACFLLWVIFISSIVQESCLCCGNSCNNKQAVQQGAGAPTMVIALPIHQAQQPGVPGGGGGGPVMMVPTVVSPGGGGLPHTQVVVATGVPAGGAVTGPAAGGGQYYPQQQQQQPAPQPPGYYSQGQPRPQQNTNSNNPLVINKEFGGAV
mmetsp:Transcript_39692/g.62055  ORF Transcript_39692/g.62055 Transcript_39692/m.62055 type:complete len:267 (+) Transcript_39692:59-859(+)